MAGRTGNGGRKAASSCFSSPQNLILPATFLCVNVVAFVVRMDLAAMMMTPNAFVLFQMKLLSRTFALIFVTLAFLITALTGIDTFYVLAIHSLFYLTILLVQEETKENTADIKKKK